MKTGVIEWETELDDKKLTIRAGVRNHLKKEWWVGLSLERKGDWPDCRVIRYAICTIQEDLMKKYSHVRLINLPPDWRLKI